MSGEVIFEESGSGYSGYKSGSSPLGPSGDYQYKQIIMSRSRTTSPVVLWLQKKGWVKNSKQAYALVFAVIAVTLVVAFIIGANGVGIRPAPLERIIPLS